MKKLFLISCLFIFSLVANAQREVTKFLGIPVDGTKTEMIQKLKAKGFTSTATDKEILEGEFNGRQVNVHIVTNNRKVYRIMVADANPVSETDIKINFNKLCWQFVENLKYIEPGFDQSIPENENILYEMSVKKKRYEAIFFQRAETDGNASETSHEKDLNRVVWFTIAENFGKYYICIYYDNGYNKANGEDL